MGAPLGGEPDPRGGQDLEIRFGYVVRPANIAFLRPYVLDHEARRRGISIDLDAVADKSLAPGAPSTWQTVVFNLMLNAIHHAPDGSTVQLRLSQNGDEILFECENQGPAIEEDVASRLFDPFVTGASGTGLGLALVERRVQEIGGVIELINEPDHIVFRVKVQSL